MNFIWRIGYDAGATPLEDALAAAAQHGFHAGMHFSAAVAERMAAARDRLLRAVDYAETGSVSLFFEKPQPRAGRRQSPLPGPYPLPNAATFSTPSPRHASGRTLPVGLHPSTTPTWCRRA